MNKAGQRVANEASSVRNNFQSLDVKNDCSNHDERVQTRPFRF